MLQSHILLDVPKGHGMCLRGPNGCGKTTLLYVLAGILESESFTIEKVDHFFLPQEHALLDHATVEDNLWVFAKLMREPRLLLDEDPFDIKSLLKQKVYTLSNGQKRRVSLTRLLMTTMKLWLLDEPEQGLDKYFTTILQDVLQAHLQKGGAIILASHTFQTQSSWEEFFFEED